MGRGQTEGGGWQKAGPLVIQLQLCKTSQLLQLPRALSHLAQAGQNEAPHPVDATAGCSTHLETKAVAHHDPGLALQAQPCTHTSAIPLSSRVNCPGSGPSCCIGGRRKEEEMAQRGVGEGDRAMVPEA